MTEAPQYPVTLERLGLVAIWCEYGGNGVEARGKRPPASEEAG